jgi:hypothetical protein
MKRKELGLVGDTALYSSSQICLPNSSAKAEPPASLEDRNRPLLKLAHVETAVLLSNQSPHKITKNALRMLRVIRGVRWNGALLVHLLDK